MIRVCRVLLRQQVCSPHHLVFQFVEITALTCPPIFRNYAVAYSLFLAPPRGHRDKTAEEVEESLAEQVAVLHMTPPELSLGYEALKQLALPLGTFEKDDPVQKVSFSSFCFSTSRPADNVPCCSGSPTPRSRPWWPTTMRSRACSAGTATRVGTRSSPSTTCACSAWACRWARCGTWTSWPPGYVNTGAAGSCSPHPRCGYPGSWGLR